MEVKEKIVGNRITQEKVLWQEDIWKLVEVLIKRALKVFLEKVLEEDVREGISATRYERTKGRKDYRNGSYLRTLLSRWGLIEDLEIPRAREGGISFRLFDKYQRRQEDVDSAIGKLFIAGVSTRKLKNITKDLFGKSLSAITCGKTTEALEKEMKIYQNKEISDKVEFLFLDGMV